MALLPVLGYFQKDFRGIENLPEIMYQFALDNPYAKVHTLTVYDGVDNSTVLVVYRN